MDESAEAIAHLRHHYAALLTMCDTYLGKVLDEMDRLDLWADTMLIVNTDHGFLLGEHDWWGKDVETERPQHHLFDLQGDPQQSREIADPTVVARMLAHLTRLMAENDAPPELFARYDLESPSAAGKPGE